MPPRPGPQIARHLCKQSLLRDGFGRTRQTRKVFAGGRAEGASLGRGSYGRVCPAWDQQEERLVAIKMQQRDSETAKREMTFFQSVQKHQNVLRLLDVIVSNSGSDLCLVFEYGAHSLSDVR